jgi:Na+-transporting methylmalonyl-CoA/oxaloacetate decarboxylase beta subunit
MVIECFVIETSGRAESGFIIIWLAGIWAIPVAARQAIRLAVRTKPVNFLMIYRGYI